MKQHSVLLFLFFISLILQGNKAQEEAFDDILDSIKSDSYNNDTFKKFDHRKYHKMQAFELGSNREEVHTHNFKLISVEFTIIENSYKACLDEIPDRLFSDVEVNNCVGKDLSYIRNDADFITRKLFGKVEAKIRPIFVSHCYEYAGLNEEALSSCDLLERDVVNLLWSGMDYPGTIYRFIEKYCRQRGRIPYDHFNSIINSLEKLYVEQEQLIVEMISHRDFIMQQVQNEIDDKISVIQVKRKNDDNFTSTAPLMRKHKIEIVEKIMPKEAHYDLSNLPAPMLLDGSNKLHDPDVETTEQKADKFLHMSHRLAGPVVYIPDRKAKQIRKFDVIKRHMTYV